MMSAIVFLLFVMYGIGWALETLWREHGFNGERIMTGNKIRYILTLPEDDDSPYTPRIVQAQKEYTAHVEENKGNDIVGTTFTASNGITITTILLKK